ncbi:hypothetical protein DFA_09734 [Cavenderia fasciculata]|uniref:Methyltransferase type 11 domain-containing protein n=1 Tax=Cavenderia fasciculata TaxID=261658 RepID=F4Q8G2_CACFS|nr:uncharacterized protein DFA_09734 [Cavenderia fasciculata]EGG16062.1 hypothetical protein DFA_09734 [Cavenderia fasciculata]|eukprot:XP_004352387.1 hypothetical protein DFA_09734 [Cavenderia fasciculata]
MNSQNIYDDNEFFRLYSILNSKPNGAPDSIPTFRFLEKIKSTKTQPKIQCVLELACGNGWFSNYMATKENVKSVRAFDLSENMLDLAKRIHSHPVISYELADMETIQLPNQSFDLGFSSLALHYVLNFKSLVQSIHQSLNPGGHFFAIIEHPIYTAPTVREWIPNTQDPPSTGSCNMTRGEMIWPLYDYQVEGDRVVDWIVNGVLKRHRTMSTYLNIFMDCGFDIRGIEEFSPPTMELNNTVHLEIDRHRPKFLILSVQKHIE